MEETPTVELVRTDKPGGKVGATTIKIMIKNLADDALIFNQNRIAITVLHNKKNYLGYKAELKSTLTAEYVKKGETKTVEREITFHTFQLEEGAKLTIVAEYEGNKAEKVIVVKRK